MSLNPNTINVLDVCILHTCDNFMMTMREICFLDEGDWGLNEGDFLTMGSSCFSYHFHMV